jgi:tetratricopeptide (TPR) repeat protein
MGLGEDTGQTSMQTNKTHYIVLLALCLKCISAPVHGAEDWKSLYRAGEEKLQSGQIELARRQLLLALSAAQSSPAEPQDVAVILDALGRAWFRLGRYVEAATTFERALKLSTQASGRVPILCNAAQSYREAGEAALAGKYLREALTIAPTEPHAWRLLGSVLIRQRKFSEAEEAERKAFSLGDQTIKIAVLSDLAMIHETRGNHAEAANELRAAIDLARAGYERARLLSNLGAAELKLGNSGAGLAHLRNSLEEMEVAVGPRHPDVAGILELYSSALVAARRKPEARQAARRAKEIRALLGSTVDWRDLK